MAFQFGTTGGHLLPLSGDWYASGTTTLGLYDPSTSLFSLRCSNCAGFADTTFQYGPAGAGWIPIVGDWTGTGSSDVVSQATTMTAPSSATLLQSGLQPSVNLGLASGERQPTSDVPALTQSSLQPIIAKAIDRWAAAGLDAADVAKLSNTQFVIATLPGNHLALTEPNQVLIDPTADGYGWFVDPTPAGNTNFAEGSDGQLHAIDPWAIDRMDLVTVVEHELGHVLGLGDRSNGQADIMDETLGVGIRRNVLAADVDAVFAEAIGQTSS